MTNSYVILALIIIIPMIIGIGVFSLITDISKEQNKLEAQKIIDFRNTDYSCDEIVKFYLKFETKKWNSITDSKWYHEARNKLIDNQCISNEKLNNLEFIEICRDGKTVGCEISKLENPELYENFNFELSIKKQILEGVN